MRLSLHVAMLLLWFVLCHSRFHRQNDQPAVYPEKHLRHFIMFFILLHQILSKRRKGFFGQSGNQKCSCQNIVDMPILIPERAVQWAAFQLAFFVADYGYRVIVGINRLNVPSYLVL